MPVPDKLYHSKRKFALIARILAPTVFAASMVAAAPAMARPAFDALVSFGDSYADPNVNLLPFLTGQPHVYPSPGASPAAIAAAYPYVAFPYWLEDKLGLSDGQVTNYAIGGSTTQAVSALGTPLSLPFQLATWNGRPFGPNDLVTLSFGGNDGLVASGALHTSFPFNPVDGLAFDDATAAALADLASANMSRAIDNLTAAGARNILIASFSDMTGLPLSAAAPHRASLAVYGRDYFALLQERLRPSALSGTRIFLFDVARIGARARDNLAAYGFGSYEYVAGSSLPSVFQPDGVHLSTRGFEVVSLYMLRALSAPYAVAAGATVAHDDAAGFTGAVFDRLQAGMTADGAGRYSGNGGVTVYALGNIAGGDVSADRGATDFDRHGGSGAIGAEYHLAPSVLAGGVIGYAGSSGSTDDGTELSDDSLQLAAYASYFDSAWMGTMSVGYGRHEIGVDRPAVIDRLHGRTTADSLGAAVRAGRQFDFGGFGIGPLAGLDYLRTEAGSYGEDGDPLASVAVGAETVETITGQAGLLLRADGVAGESRLGGYLAVTWQHEFGDNTRAVTIGLTQAPLLPVRTPVSNFEARDYGRVAAGFSITLMPQVSAVMTAASDIARDEGERYRFGAAFNIGF